MPFNYEALTKPTLATLLFISKLSDVDKPIIFNDNGKVTSVTADFNKQQLTKWKADKYRVFVWKERIHDKKGEDNNKIYYNHYMYRYFLVPADKAITVKPSENRFDFGFHRVKDSLTENKAILFLTVTEEDLTGYQKR